MATRSEIIDELSNAGWDGPTSYTKTRLEELAATVGKKGVDAAKATLPRRGRPAAPAAE